MATILDKDITRLSTEKYGGREILVTLTEDQNVQMKLKGLKSGNILQIGIKTLFDQLSGQDEPVIQPQSIEPLPKDDDLISISDFRHMMNTESLDIETKVLFDSLCSDIIKRRKNNRQLSEIQKQQKKKQIA